MDVPFYDVQGHKVWGATAMMLSEFLAAGNWHSTPTNNHPHMQDKFFQLINLLPMPVWLAMMFAPNHKFTRRASRSSAIFGIMGLTYVTALIAAIHGGSSSETSDPAGGGMDFTSLDGIRRGPGTREGALAGWAHFLALDLFAGAWIYQQAQKTVRRRGYAFQRYFYADDGAVRAAAFPDLAHRQRQR